MNLYIQLENGEPVNHPILEENFVQAFPNIDLNNLPETFARFERITSPEVGVYEVSEGTTYEWVDCIVKDVHHIRAMTLEERTAKQDADSGGMAKSGIDGNAIGCGNGGNETCDGSDDGCCSDVKD
jgi:hypothetical protein